MWPYQVYYMTLSRKTETSYETLSFIYFHFQVWFQNRRAKFRKMERAKQQQQSQPQSPAIKQENTAPNNNNNNNNNTNNNNNNNNKEKPKQIEETRGTYHWYISEKFSFFFKIFIKTSTDANTDGSLTYVLRLI